MKKINYTVYLCSVLVIIVLVMFEYAYSAPAHFFADYQSVFIDTGGIDSATEKQSLIDLSDEYDTNILFNQLHIDNKESYTVYSTEPVSLPNFPGIYKSMENKEFSSLESSNIYNHELFFEETPRLNDLIDELSSIGMKVTRNPQSVAFYTLSKTTILILILTLVLNFALILINFSNNLKRYGLFILEGYSISKLILKEVFISAFNIFSFSLLTCFALLIVLQPEIYVYKWLLIATSVYILLITIFKIFTIRQFKYDSIINYIKGFNQSNRIINFLLFLKIIMFGYLILTIPLMAQTIDNINEFKQQIDSYSKYDDIVISQEYSSSISSNLDEQAFMEAAVAYYQNTVEDFGGIIYYMTKDEASVNYNALDYINILDPNGHVLTEEDLDPNETTYLVSEDAMNNIDSEANNVLEIKGGQKFLSIELGDLSDSKMVTPQVIEYYPRDLQDVGNSNVDSVISKSGYFLNVPGDNKFETLKPYIEKSNAEGQIVSAPGITIEMKQNLTAQIEKAVGNLYIILLSAITVILIILFSISTYIKLNSKNIVIKSLEGQSNYKNLKIIYITIGLETIVGLMFLSTGRASFVATLICIVIELALTSVLSKKLLKQNLNEFMKGNQ